MADEKITHALEDILHDSVLWSESAEALHDASIQSLTTLLGKPSQFSHLAMHAGLYEQYEEIRMELARLLAEGASVQNDISDTLITTAKHYEETEQDALSRLQEVEQRLEDGAYSEQRQEELEDG